MHDVMLCLGMYTRTRTNSSFERFAFPEIFGTNSKALNHLIKYYSVKWRR